MRINFQTEYAFRILIFLQIKPDENISTRQIAEAFNISVTHLNKVSQHLVRLGLLESTRGRNGGIMLAQGVLDKKVGDVMRAIEPSEDIAQCRGKIGLAPCAISPVCKLQGVLAEGKEAFWGSLNQYTLGELVTGEENANDIRLLLSM